VPADRVAQVRAELDPVFAMLAATAERCATTTADGRLKAAQVADETQAEAERMAAKGTERAAAARAMAVKDALGAADAEADRIRRVAAAAVPTRPAEDDVLDLIDLAIDFIKSLPPDALRFRDERAGE
jgi:hypothetical protein